MDYYFSGVKIRLLTYNIHKCVGIDRKYGPDRVRETIAHHDPDIVLMQEVTEGVSRMEFHRQVDLLAHHLTQACRRPIDADVHHLRQRVELELVEDLSHDLVASSRFNAASRKARIAPSVSGLGRKVAPASPTRVTISVW